MKRKPDPLLKTQPWKVFAVFHPLEMMLSGIKRNGTVDTEGDKVVFEEQGGGGWYDATAALRGVIDFHRIARDRYGIQAEIGALIEFADKLDTGAPIFESDLEAVEAAISSCKGQAMALRVSQAVDIVRILQIQAESEKRKVA